MMDENNADEAPVADDSMALEATPDGDNPDGSPDGPAPDEQQADPRERKLSRENQSLRKRLRDIEAQLKQREEAELSEQERANRRMVEMQAELDATRNRARDAALRATIAQEASAHGIVDADAAARLLDTTGLEYDDEAGAWIGVPDALRALVLERPWLVQTGGVPAKDANPANPARRRSRLTKEQLSRMSQAEIDALPWEDVQAALAE